jgi:hypothetical protein
MLFVTCYKSTSHFKIQSLLNSGGFDVIPLGFEPRTTTLKV